MFENKQKTACFVYIPCANGLKKSKISSQTVAISLAKIEKAHTLPPVVAVLNVREDLEFAREVASLLGGVKIVCPKTPRELLEVLSDAKFVISQRYHGSLFATISKLPALCISNDPKMHAFCKDFGLFPSQSVDIFQNSDVLIEQIDRVKRHYENNCEKIEKTVEFNTNNTRESLKKLTK